MKLFWKQSVFPTVGCNPLMSCEISLEAFAHKIGKQTTTKSRKIFEEIVYKEGKVSFVILLWIFVCFTAL